MKEKNIKNMSNSDLRLYKKELENEYEAVKMKIQLSLDKLLEIDNEYKKIDSELNNRKNLSV